jgi:hypothetical protein
MRRELPPLITADRLYRVRQQCLDIYEEKLIPTYLVGELLHAISSDSRVYGHRLLAGIAAHDDDGAWATGYRILMRYS